MYQVPGGAQALPEQALGALRPRRTALNHFTSFITKKPLGAIGAGIALFLIVIAIFAPAIATDDPRSTTTNLRESPSTESWFGTDNLGRDVFSRAVYGARISLYVGIVSALVGCSLGLLVGVAGVQLGGVVDLLIQRVIDAMMAFPALVLAIAIMAALGSSVNNVVIALSIIYIPSTARILRSQALTIKEQDYVLAARAIGAGHWRIIFKHMIPNTMAVFIVIVTFHFGGAIIAEATLSFLGIGAPPDVPTWGGMLRGASGSYIAVAPWLLVFPGLAIGIVVFAWNLLGDSLRDVLDPRLRGTT